MPCPLKCIPRCQHGVLIPNTGSHEIQRLSIVILEMFQDLVFDFVVSVPYASGTPCSSTGLVNPYASGRFVGFEKMDVFRLAWFKITLLPFHSAYYPFLLYKKKGGTNTYFSRSTISHSQSWSFNLPFNNPSRYGHFRVEGTRCETHHRDTMFFKNPTLSHHIRHPLHRGAGVGVPLIQLFPYFMGC